MTAETWKDVWERKGRSAAGKGEYTVTELFSADGFDTATGTYSQAGQARVGAIVRERLGVAPGRRILEVGCGAGAVLSLLAGSGAELAGVDYSAPHIAIARQVLPFADLRVAEASALPFAGGAFDAVFSFGVFLYFHDLAYAAASLGEMVRVAAASAPILVLDIPDEATREECMAVRRAAGASLSPAHLYYPRSFFRNFASQHSRRAVIFQQEIPGYGNSDFRYNVLLEA
jgi:cyclopropane fatty-acyl-phospholipid synthase-like methyltransferase